MTESHAQKVLQPARALLVGNPNTGKTTLFNRLTGLTAKTGNFHGVTVEKRDGHFSTKSYAVTLSDLPGTYSLTPRSPDEAVATDAVLGVPSPNVVIVVVDASTLSRSLYLALQILETELRVVLALNFADEVKRSGIKIDTAALSTSLGCPVVLLSARRQADLGELHDAVDLALTSPRTLLNIDYGPAEQQLADTTASIPNEPMATVRARAAAATLAGRRLTDTSLTDDIGLGAANGDTGRAVIEARYRFIDGIIAEVVRAPNRGRDESERIDRWLTHPVFGSAFFLVVMTIMFQALFRWSEPAMSAIEAATAFLATGTENALGGGNFAQMVAGGVIGGAGNVAVFVPQIAFLSLFIVLLEDCGYLARVVFIVDRLMRAIGMQGRAFVPLISSYACAVPSIAATRTIEDPKERFAAIMAIPYVSCSARLPVYTLVSAVVFANAPRYLGFEASTLALLAMYGLSAFATIGALFVFRRTVLRGKASPLVLELPPYRVPVLATVLRTVWERTRSFLIDAGTTIVAISVVLWVLLHYPQQDPSSSTASRPNSTETASEEGRAAVALEHSYAGQIGHWLEPVLEPLGFDWRIGIGLVASFAAREVLVSTLGMVYGVGEVDESSAPLRSRLRQARDRHGQTVFTPLRGISLMVFFVLAAQCMSTLAAVKRETRSYKWPLLMLVSMNVVAYMASLIVYQGGLIFGFQ